MFQRYRIMTSDGHTIGTFWSMNRAIGFAHRLNEVNARIRDNLRSVGQECAHVVSYRVVGC